MNLGELNEIILNEYARLISEYDIGAEEVLKSLASVTVALMNQMGAESIKTPDGVITLTE